jgi:hypothetical protein
MAVTTLTEIIGSAKKTLQETTASGTRWLNSELVSYLNDSYRDIVRINPDANAVNESFTCVAGTRQRIPASGLRLLNVTRNIAPSSRAITMVDRRSLDATNPFWHDTVVDDSVGVEQFSYDSLDPKTFYLSPGAKDTTQIELVYSAVPTGHTISGETIPGEVFKLDDIYVPAAINYVLYKAYAKDSEFAGNDNRAQLHYQIYMQALTGKVQTDQMTTPQPARG